MIDTEPSLKDLHKLWSLCSSFIKDQRIYCSETIYQTDRVIENAYEFIDNICQNVGFAGEE
jgi:hypothetical protein